MVVCVCVWDRARVARVVAFARASGFDSIRGTNPRRIDRSRARTRGDRARGVDGVARASSVRHGRAGERESWEKNDGSIARDGSDARARARGCGRGARAAGGADGARRGGGGAWGGNRGDSCVASALSGKNGRGWTEKNVASADGKASTSKATGADGLGLGGGTAPGRTREGRREDVRAPRAILESREMSMDGDDDAALLAAMEGVDLSALAAQVDKLSAEVDELDGAAARRRAPNRG